MGVEYQHFLIPEDNTYRPGPEELARLVNALFEAGFVARAGSGGFKSMADQISTDFHAARDTGCYVHLKGQRFAPFPSPCLTEDFAALEGQEYKLVWPVESSIESGLKYPLDPYPEDVGDAYYDLEIHMARDFVYQTAECISPFDDVRCRCGQDLEFYEKYDGPTEEPVFYWGRIHQYCPACGEPFLPQRLMAQIRVGRAGHAGERAGGATYRFAVVVDCGKGWARETDAPIRAADAFVRLASQSLGRRFYEIGEYY